jgi:DNA-binding response OmpR family regulator
MTAMLIDEERHRVRCGTQWRNLSPQMWHLFLRLHRHQGRIVHGEVLFGLHGAPSTGREMIRLLRRRLADSPFRITTWRTIGYELTVDEELDREAA